jgi:CRP-like cAMP-binding protein
LGSVREVVSRILEDLRAQDIVRLDRGQIYVLDVIGNKLQCTNA